MGRAMHDVQYDEVNDEIIIANPFAQAIMTYRGGADGEEAPIRIIQGPRTQIQSPDVGVSVDNVHDELFVSDADAILVFSRTANGDVAPIRVIRGPDTQLSAGARGMAVDPIRNLIVSSHDPERRGDAAAAGNSSGGSILIFNRTDRGNVAPLRVIKGPKTGLPPRSSIIQLRVYPPKGLILVPIRGGRGEDGERTSGTIAVWSIHDSGDIPPRWLIGGPQSQIRTARIALNPEAKEVIAGTKTYYVPEIF